MYQRRTNRCKLRNNYEKSLKSRIFDKFFASNFQIGHKKDFAWQKGSNNPYKLKEPVSFKKKFEILLKHSRDIFD